MGTLRIATPCHEEWDRMTPSAEGRSCASCRLEVVDLSEAPLADARARIAAVRSRLAAQPHERVCIRGESDGRGRILTPARRRLFTDAFAGMLAMAMAGCAGGGPALAPDHGGPAPQVTAQAPPPTKAAIDPGSGSGCPQAASPRQQPTGQVNQLMGEPSVQPAQEQTPAVVPKRRIIMGAIVAPRVDTPPKSNG